MSEITVEVVEIGPEFAEQLLARNSGNRKIRKGRVASLAKSMIDGRWMLNGEAIKIAEDGRLLDGQHRLAAIVASGVTIRTLLIRNVVEEAFMTMDSGLNRTPGDALGVEANAGSIATLVNLVIRYEAGNPLASQGVPIPRTETYDRFTLDPERFTECTAAANRASFRFKPHNRTYVGLLLFKVPESEAFLEAVTSGVGLEAGSPALALRNYLINSVRGGGRNRASVLAAYINAWNAQAQGRRLQNVRPVIDPFPKIRS